MDAAYFGLSSDAHSVALLEIAGLRIWQKAEDSQTPSSAMSSAKVGMTRRSQGSVGRCCSSFLGARCGRIWVLELAMRESPSMSVRALYCV